MSSSNPALFVLKYNRQQVLVAPPKDYAQLQFAIRDHFPNIPDEHRVSYFTKNLPICKGVLTKISREIWASTIPKLDHLIVRSEVARVSSPTTSKRLIKQEDLLEFSSDDESERRPPQKKIRHETHSHSTSNASPRKKLTLFISSTKDNVENQSAAFSPSTTIRKLASWVKANKGFVSSSEFRIIWRCKQIEFSEYETLESLGIQDGDKINVVERLKGGKPVIYLFPPLGSDINASVKLSLVPEWHFSGIYPVVPITSSSSGNHSLKWDVKASPDGTILERFTGLKVAYLFWEAEALALSPITLAFSPEHISTQETFIPTHPRISPGNSIALEVSKITPYLDSALGALGLHVEARTSFITYWLPSFLKHTHVALRFLPQSAYERAAPLEVEPKPDVVVRVFMLFKGLKQSDLSPESMWYTALKPDEMKWSGVVGVDENRKLDDTTLFRVVEWGGMEVLS